MSTASIKAYAEQLAEKLMEIEDAKVECKSIIEAAKEEGINPKVLRKVSKEMITDSTKLADKYAEESQLEMFRDAVDIHVRKGLVQAFKEAAE